MVIVLAVFWQPPFWLRKATTTLPGTPRTMARRLFEPSVDSISREIVHFDLIEEDWFSSGHSRCRQPRPGTLALLSAVATAKSPRMPWSDLPRHLIFESEDD